MVANSLPTPHTPSGEIRDDVRVKLPSLDGLRGLAVLLVVPHSSVTETGDHQWTPYWPHS